ncbi:MAG: hypothetical protein R8F63_01885 [Acidimicrobiales bacterium]|nr:hypothetical protein [Acidimicrobiales bacterium]
MTRRTLTAVAVVAFALLLLTNAAGAQTDDVADQCRTIIGCADAGPKPENPGDRGGYAQLLLFGGLVGGMGFITWRVVRTARATAAQRA